MTGPLRRRGPRPLPLHLGLAGMRAMAATQSLHALPAPPGMPWPSGLPSWSGAWPISKAGQAERARILGNLAAAGHPPEALAGAVLRRLLRADRALIAGIAAYRRHPWRRDLADPPAIWAEGASRLLDYGDGAAPPGRTVLVVPSLINRAYVLDLAPGASFLRFLAAAGVRPLLLDWGWPGEEERRFTLTDYIAGRLVRAAQAANQAAGERVVLAGYCMGGTMAVGAAAHRPDLFAALAALATPWDFHAADGGAQGRSLAAALPLLEPLMDFNGTLPVDALQMLFAALDPYAIADKYRGFAALDPASPRAEKFVALEDWLNDGVPLAAPVAREALGDWYGANAPARGAWRVAGMPVRPETLSLPALVAVPARDRIVPPASAEALAAALPQAQVLRPAAGHIGMVAGASAERASWRPFLDWLSTLP